MTKTFRLPLLSALPALLVACGKDATLDRYSRQSYNSYADCQRMYSAQIRNGLSYPCQQSTGSTGGGGSSSSGRYWGPYTYQDGHRTHFVGYSPSGLPASSGLSYDTKKGTYGSFKAPGVSRGGFTTSSRSSGSLGG